MRHFIKITLILLIIVFLSAVLIYVIDTITGTNTVDQIKVSIDNILNPKEEVVEELDTTPLKVEYFTTEVTIYQGSTSVTLISNKEISIDGESKHSLVLAQLDEGNSPKKYYYALEINNIGIGDANVSLNVVDKAGNSSNIKVKVTREGFSLPFGMNEIEDWENSSYTSIGDDLLALVNKEYKLIDDYAPSDLLNLNQDYLLYTNKGDILLRKEAADYLSLMLGDLYDVTGRNVVIASGYRSYIEQYSLYASWVRQLGQSEADKISARPGFSEHQLGTVVDFIEAETGLELTNDFDDSTVGKWLLQNAYKYGYVLPYPEGKENITGYLHEAWHWRYIGVDNANLYKESGLTLKEWLEQSNNRIP